MAASYTGLLGVLHDWQDLAGALSSTLVAGVAIAVSISALHAAKDQVELGRKQLDLVRRHEDACLLDAAIIYAQSTSCLSYARRSLDSVAPLSWDDVDSAMMSLSFHGPRQQAAR